MMRTNFLKLIEYLLFLFFDNRKIIANPIAKDKLDSTLKENKININPINIFVLFLLTKFLKPKSKKYVEIKYCPTSKLTSICQIGKIAVNSAAKLDHFPSKKKSKFEYFLTSKQNKIIKTTKKLSNKNSGGINKYSDKTSTTCTKNK